MRHIPGKRKTISANPNPAVSDLWAFHSSPSAYAAGLGREACFDCRPILLKLDLILRDLNAKIVGHMPAACVGP